MIEGSGNKQNAGISLCLYSHYYWKRILYSFVHTFNDFKMNYKS